MKRGEDLFYQLAKELQVASAKLCEAVRIWSEYEKNSNAREKIKGLNDEIVEAERKCDDIKEELINNIFSKRAYLPQATGDRYRLVRYIDDVVNKTEIVIRRLVAKKDFPQRIPHEMPLLAEKVHRCTDYIQDALKFLNKDFEKALPFTRKLEAAREEARDLDFHIFGRLNSPDYTTKDAFYIFRISMSLVAVADAAEETGNFIQAMAVKYGY
ncbi:MAG: DUF47 domain-containing protein [Candidatus Hodarchaeales archaeon]